MMTQIDQKKAEALLENIQENPAHLMRLRMPKGERQGVKSGKDW